MRKSFSLVFWLGPAIACLAQPLNPPTRLTPIATPAPSAAAPKIQFAETTYDFGKVESGQMVKHAFTFTNVGSVTLEVSNVTTSCGCTTAGAWDKSVEPGKSGIIPIQFNSSGWGGSVAKTVTVTCNDPAQTSLTLHLNGTVWKPIDVIPAFAVFNLPPENQTHETKVLKILNNLDEPVTISAPTNRNPAFDVELTNVIAGKQFELRVTVNPPIGEGQISAPYTLYTSSARVPQVTVLAVATGQARVAVNPPTITLPPGPLAEASRQALTIQNNTTNAMVLSEPSLDSKAGLSPNFEKVTGVDVEIKEAAPGKIFSVVLDFPAGFQIGRGRSLELHLKTNFPKYNTITVQVIQPLPAPPAPQPQAKSGG